jgi:hypothetical protein
MQWMVEIIGRYMEMMPPEKTGRKTPWSGWQHHG